MDKEEDDRLIQEALDRKPSPYPKLLMPLDNDRNAHLSASVLNSASYIESYFLAAERLSKEAFLGPAAQEHEVVLPILFLYRHFTELSLKSCVSSLGWLIKKHVAAYGFKAPEHHRLLKLLKQLRSMHGDAEPYLKKLKLPSHQALGFIEELAILDDESSKFRYLLVKDKQERAIGEDLYFNLDALDVGMLHVREELKWYRDMVLETANG